MRTNLILNRMIIVKGSHHLYDELYHHGVNIIHGDNGSGKSTLADFIFFGLGGDLREWKPHAALADYVLLEVQARDSVITLKRDVSPDGGRPMQIIFESLEKALATGPVGWQLLPYKRPEPGLSFSQVLFRAIGIPEAISEGSSNITMHQVLRLLYADQMTPIQRIFRVENFDTWQTRQAVGELICGIGGYELYDSQIQIRDLLREHGEASVRLRNLMSVAASYGDKILAEHIDAAIANLSNERDKILLDLEALLSAEDAPHKQLDDAAKLRRDAQRELGQARKHVAETEDRIETLRYEMEDAGQFIAHLQQSLSDFDDAYVTFSSLGHIRFEFCPSCFAPTLETSNPLSCHLCGADTVKERDESKALAVRLDIEMQLRESSDLQREREATLGELNSALRVGRVRLRKAMNSSELSRGGSPSGRESAVAEFSRKVGFLDSEIEVLHKRLELAKEVAELSEAKENLNTRLTKLKIFVEAIISGQARRKQQAYSRISSNTKKLLESDLSEHSDFGDIQRVTFDFSGDWIAINDDKNRSGSASGLVVLKNSFFLGMLLSSIQDPEFYLPRWMLFDNIEDKGMVQERAWHFQRTIIREFEKTSGQKQLIFTTSKIAPELASTPYVVGRKYTKARPVLEFSRGQGVATVPSPLI
jgi:hypothetical protein